MAFTRELNSAGDTTISRFFCRSGGTNLERKDFWRAASTKLNLEALQDLIALTEESEGACPSNLERSGAVCRKRSGTRSPKISPRSCRR